MLIYNIQENVRTRILVILSEHTSEVHGGFDALLADVGKFLFKQYGNLFRSSFQAARRSDNPVIEHFYVCDTDHALDFIEACFQQTAYEGGQAGVDEINAIFNETGLGYNLTPFVEHRIEKDTFLFGAKRKGIVVEYEYPQVIRRDDQMLHQSVIEPTLALLSDSRLRIANSEILKAHSALRHGQYEDAITYAGSAFESLLKTICDIKGWGYDPNKDTSSRLINICRDHNLFPPFYTPFFESVGTIRNKLSGAHGRGPSPLHQVRQEHAEHMLYLTSTHMLLMARLAGIR